MHSLAIAPGSNVLALHPILKYARDWSLNINDADAETAFLKAVSLETLNGTVPFVVVQHTAKKTPWLVDDVRMLTWTQTWLRYSLLRASTAPCPEFTDGHVSSLILAGGWLRGRAELHGAGIPQEERVHLMQIWKSWTNAAQSEFINSAVGVLTLHFMLKTSYLQHALYTCSSDSLNKVLTDILPGKLEQNELIHDMADAAKLDAILCSLPGASLVLKNTFVNLTVADS